MAITIEYDSPEVLLFGAINPLRSVATISIPQNSTPVSVAELR